MKPTRTESLVSWLWTGAILIGVSLFFLIRGWFLAELGMPPVSHRGGALDSHMAVGGAILLFIIGVAIVIGAVTAKVGKP
jgi:hypothetical protein